MRLLRIQVYHFCRSFRIFVDDGFSIKLFAKLYDQTLNMPAPILISSYQCARLLQTTKEHVRKLLDSGKIDYFRDDEWVFRIRLDSVLEYATRSKCAIDEEYYVNLTRRFSTTIRNSGFADLSSRSEQDMKADEEAFPSDRAIWRVGMAIAERFRNRKFLDALYQDERLADMMFRYFSGETLEQIGDAYGLTRERARQLCKKGMNRLMHQLSYFTKDVVEMKVDKETKSDTAVAYTQQELGLVEINGMRFSRRARTVFRKHGITTVEQLKRLSKAELIRLPGLGRKTLVEINRVLEYAATPESPQKAFQLRPWTDEDIEQVMTLKRSGGTFQEIASKVGRFPIDVQDQYYIRMRELRNEGALSDSADAKSTGAADDEPKPPIIWSEEEVSQLVSMRSRGMIVRDIAKQLQRNQREVSSKLEELGLKIRYRNIAELSDEEKDELVSRFQQDESLADIAEEQQLKQVDMAFLLFERGELPERNSRSGQPWDLAEIDELRSYVERDYPIGEIGYRLGRDHREVTSQIYELVKTTH